MRIPRDKKAKRFENKTKCKKVDKAGAQITFDWLSVWLTSYLISDWFNCVVTQCSSGVNPCMTIQLLQRILSCFLPFDRFTDCEQIKTEQEMNNSIKRHSPFVFESWPPLTLPG